MTSEENKICKYEASTWCKYLAIRDIVAVLFGMLSILEPIGLVSATKDDECNEEPRIFMLGSMFVASLLGITMGVVLQRGTYRKGVGVLKKAWIIFQWDILILIIVLAIYMIITRVTEVSGVILAEFPIFIGNCWLFGI